MKLQYASDLHLEFPENKQFITANPLRPAGDILLLAGDIIPFPSLKNADDFFHYLSDHFKTTYWIPGNHEYYRFDISEKSGTLDEKIRENVHLVNNVVKHQDDVSFILSTMWTHISPANEWQIEKGMSDFRLIQDKRHRFSTQRYNELHRESMTFIEEAFRTNQLKKTVVVTHHVPTIMNYPEQYRDSILNEGFAVEHFDLIQAHQPEYWIYGHHHANIPDFYIGKTNMRTNQLGYVHLKENRSFDAEKTFVL
jgi:predicted phosphohydrolase